MMADQCIGPKVFSAVDYYAGKEAGRVQAEVRSQAEIASLKKQLAQVKLKIQTCKTSLMTSITILGEYDE